MTTTIHKRFKAHDKPPADGLELVRGTIADYNRLKAYHYRAKKPATATRVLAFRHAKRSAVSRFLDAPAETSTAAVLVESLPSLGCRMRNWALHDRYGAWLEPHQRAVLLNREVRVISRVVVHPCWRGLGLAVRLVKAALAEPATLYTEALAAMGRVNPFFERAGMTAYHRPAHAFDARLIDAMHLAGLTVGDLAMPDRMRDNIEQLDHAKRDWIFNELHRWYRQTAGRSANHSQDPDDHLRAARSRLMLEPVYYLHENSTEHLGLGSGV